ncbi:retrovirus-related pol polyprotein from transposon TNT 1-94 [Tanacetum coccineum]
MAELRESIDTARTIRLHADLPIKFWGDCILVATYLINKMPMEVLSWKTPFEKLFGTLLVYDHLRVIGCLCYAAVTIPHKDKFDKRGTKCVLLGYPLNKKGYTLYNLDTRETFHSRDVIFEESVFPFKDCNKHTPQMVTNDFPTFGDEDSTNAAPPEQVRRSTRQTNKPVWLKDFVDPTANKSTPHYPLFVSIYFSRIPIPHIAFLANVFSNPEPSRYKQAVQYTGWRQAMDKELAALEKNNTWTLTVLPPGHKPISSKWVYKTKYNPDGTVERLKARLVVRGFNQQERLDYKHNFSLIAKLATELTKFLIAKGYQQSKHDYSLFVKTKDESFTTTHVYVDNVLITGNSPSEIQHLKQALDIKFTIKDLGLAKYFLGIEICNTANGTHLNQRKYILYLLTDAGLTAAKPNPSPLPTNLKLSLNKGVPLSAAYRRLVGRLLYLTMTRPNISYVVQHLSQFVSSPKDVHLQAAIHLLKYLKGSVSKGLFYLIQPHLKVTGFSDADWASCLMTRKSLTGYCIFFGHSLVSWKTKKQATLSRSSTEAEYRSMATTTCELLWLSFLLKDLHIPVKLPITLFCDNKSAQQIAANPCFHDRTKHMAIDCHFTREKVEDGFLQIAFIPSHSISRHHDQGSQSCSTFFLS